LGLDAVRKAGRRLLEPLIRLLARLGVNPSAVTVTGFAVSVLASWLVWSGLYWQGALVLAAASVLDAVDGGLARERKKESLSGAILDSSLDRMAELMVLTAVLAGPAGREHGAIIYLAPAAIGGSFMVSYVRARAEGVGMDCTVGFFTRAERLVLLIIGLFLAGLIGNGSAVLVWTLSLMAAGAWLTAGQRLVTVMREGRRSFPA
jgi:CDP-diacylglycerol--glycerol-3-phosphate 3-phosphatidyltransferase